MRPVLVLSPSYFGLGGAQRYARQFAAALAAALGPDRVLVWSFLEGRGEAGAGVRYLGGAAAASSARGKMRFAAGAARWAREAGLIVATHVSVAPVALWLSRIRPRPYVVCTHGIEVWGRIPTLRRIALRRAARVVAVSRFTATRLRQDHGVDAGRIALIPPVVDAGLLRRAAQAAGRGVDGVHRLLTVARLAAAERYKGCDTVLRCLARLKPAVGAVRYTIVGDGDDRARLQALAGELGVEGCTRFAGPATDDALAGYYAESDFFVMPSRAGFRDGRWHGEGFGIVFIEAAAFGVPAIAGRGDGAEDAVTDGVTGLLVDGGDLSSVIEAIRTMLEDPARRRRMGEAARARVLREFVPARMERQVRELLGALGMAR